MPHIAYIDTIDACHLKCPGCIRGARGMQNTAAKMPLDLFAQVVAKIRDENYNRIGLYSWTEPFLNRTLNKYVRVVKDAGLACDISSTLSLRRIPHLEAVLCAGVDHIIVSMSGADQETYQRYHVGGTLAYALANLERIREIIDRSGLSPTIRMRLLRFHYNGTAEPILRQRADELGFSFETIDAGGNPDLGPSQVLYQTPQWFLAKSAEGTKKPVPDGSQVCPLMFDQLTIDCHGDVHLCCAFPTVDAIRIGKYLDLPESELLLKRFRHPFCRACTAYPWRPATSEDTQRLADARARPLRRARFDGLIQWWSGNRYRAMPQKQAPETRSGP